MKVFRSKAAEWIHSFIYGYPGCGKTKFIADFHNAKQDVIVVAGYNASRTLESYGVDCPIIVPDSLDELIAIVQMPEEVVAKVVQPEFPGYVCKTWAFDILKDLQMIIFGESRIKSKKIFDGALELPDMPPTGIMALPNSRDGDMPSNKDYRVLDMKLRALLRSIEKMPYHTIVTAHAEKDYSLDTQKKLTGDPTKDKDLKHDAVMVGYPALEGFSAKNDISGLAGEMLLYLETSNQKDFYIYPKPHHQGFHARTQLAEFMPPRIDWSGKNAYNVLDELIKRGRKNGDKKG